MYNNFWHSWRRGLRCSLLLVEAWEVKSALQNARRRASFLPEGKMLPRSTEPLSWVLMCKKYPWRASKHVHCSKILLLLDLRLDVTRKRSKADLNEDHDKTMIMISSSSTYVGKRLVLKKGPQQTQNVKVRDRHHDKMSSKASKSQAQKQEKGPQFRQFKTSVFRHLLHQTFCTLVQFSPDVQKYWKKSGASSASF